MRRTLSKLIRRSRLKWHLPDKVSRMDVIQRAVDRLGAKRYLEIGVWQGECFCAVRVSEKIGVDRIPPEPAVAAELSRTGVSYQQMTSDEFFATRAPSVLAAGVDVVFVDGLHTDAQTLRDCEQSLRHLAPGGVIFVHDCRPASAAEACPAATYAEALQLNGPHWNGWWTGDGWKAIVRLRARHDDVRAAVLDCDHGLGVIWRDAPSHALALSAADIDALTFADLAANPTHLLGLRSPAFLDDVLEVCARRRAAACAS